MIVKDKLTKKQSTQPFFRRTLPKTDINNTPIRTRDNKQNSYQNIPLQISIKQRQNTNDNQSFQNSPYNSQALSSRTIPRRKNSNYSKNCANHLQLQGQFKIQIDGEFWLYCNKCAAHLASNGFQVQKIVPSKSPIRPKQMIKSPYGANKRKSQLNNFLQSLKGLTNNFRQRQNAIRKAQLSHGIQKETITNFYASMFQYLEYVRDQHLRYLQEEGQKQQQVAQIQIAQIQQAIQQMAGMVEDIQNNIDKIVEEVQETNYNQCMNYYSQKKQLHEHRLTELGSDVMPAICTTAQYVEEKLNQFKNFMDELTGMLGSKADSGY